jgi:hypothetical protein
MCKLHKLIPAAKLQQTLSYIGSFVYTPPKFRTFVLQDKLPLPPTFIKCFFVVLGFSAVFTQRKKNQQIVVFCIKTGVFRIFLEFMSQFLFCVFFVIEAIIQTG